MSGRIAVQDGETRRRHRTWRTKRFDIIPHKFGNLRVRVFSVVSEGCMQRVNVVELYQKKREGGRVCGVGCMCVWGVVAV